MFEGEEITALQRDGDLTLAVGTSEGNLKLFDLRYPTPFLAKQHPYMEPINDICFHRQSNKMIVSDEKSIRVYDKPSYNLFTAVESKFKIHGVKPYMDSGLLLVPQEARRIGTYFIPALGVAPKWCSFIENMTEELEEKQTETIYNEYKFLTREEVDAISAANLIGTKFLQSYMNGFIMKAKLYNKMKDQSQPFDYQAYKEEMIKSVGTMYKAFQYGAPPHGGIAWGIDRLMMILEKKASIRDVMAFPKTGTSEDLLFGAPSLLSDKKVEEMNVKIIKK